MQIEWHQLDHRHERLRARRPRVERQLLASLASSGQQVPITVIREPAEAPVPAFVVIDGFRRIRSLKTLRHDAVEATVLGLPELDALLYQHAQRHREDESVVEQAWLVAELSDRFDLSLEQLSLRLGHSASWVSRRLALVRELPESVQELVRKGRIGAHAAMRSLVPLARAKPDECRELAAAVAPLQVTSRQLARVVETWRRSSPEVHRRILENPQLFLRVEETPAPRPTRSERTTRHRAPEDAERSCDPSGILLQDLDLIATLAASLGTRWSDEEPKLDARQRRQAHRSLVRARTSLEGLTLSEETPCSTGT